MLLLSVVLAIAPGYCYSAAKAAWPDDACRRPSNARLWRGTVKLSFRRADFECRSGFQRDGRAARDPGRQPASAVRSASSSPGGLASPPHTRHFDGRAYYRDLFIDETIGWLPDQRIQQNADDVDIFATAGARRPRRYLLTSNGGDQHALLFGAETRSIISVISFTAILCGNLGTP